MTNITNYPEENNVKNVSIPVELVYVQKYILNRNMGKERSSHEQLAMVKSIKKVDLISRIIVREDNTGMYELFVGNRRFEAYKVLQAGDPQQYKDIPAVIYPTTANTSDMLLKTLHENHFRKDLKKSEDTESLLSFIPFYLNIEKVTNSTENMLFGFSIMKKFNSYIRTKNNQEKYKESLQLLTGHNDVIERINNFFEKIARSPDSFYLSSRVYFNCTPRIIDLFREGKVINRNALRLEALKSKEDKEKIISRLLEDEYITSVELGKIISDSNARFSPVKSTNKSIQACNHVLIQLKRDKGKMSAQQNDEVKMYFEKIENVINT